MQNPKEFDKPHAGPTNLQTNDENCQQKRCFTGISILFSFRTNSTPTSPHSQRTNALIKSNRFKINTRWICSAPMVTSSMLSMLNQKIHDEAKNFSFLSSIMLIWIIYLINGIVIGAEIHDFVLQQL